jgi:hypothetical protein
MVDEGMAIQNTISSVFAPAADTYDIASATEAPLMPLSQSFMAGEPRLDLYPDEGRAVHDIPIWTQRFYATDEDVPLPPIGFSVTEENGRVIAEIRNHSTFLLTDHAFAWGEFHLQQAGVGSIAPGETIRTDVGSVDDIRLNNLFTVGSANDTDALNGVADMFAVRMALYRSKIENPLGMMRAYNLRLALDQGAAIWMCRVTNPEVPAAVTVDEAAGNPPASLELQLVTYKGAAL